MKKLLLFLSFPASFVVAMEQTKRPAETVSPSTTLLEIHNKSNEEVGYRVYDSANKRFIATWTLMPGQKFTGNNQLHKGDILTVAKRNFSYTPSGNTLFIDLFIYDNKAEVVPAGSK